MSKPQPPQVWTRVSPEIRQRVRDEAAVLYDGNESMLVRRAITQFLDQIDRQRQLAAASAIHTMTHGELESAVA